MGAAEVAAIILASIQVIGRLKAIYDKKVAGLPTTAEEDEFLRREDERTQRELAAVTGHADDFPPGV